MCHRPPHIALRSHAFCICPSSNPIAPSDHFPNAIRYVDSPISIKLMRDHRTSLPRFATLDIPLVRVPPMLKNSGPRIASYNLCE